MWKRSLSGIGKGEALGRLSVEQTKGGNCSGSCSIYVCGAKASLLSSMYQAEAGIKPRILSLQADNSATKPQLLKGSYVVPVTSKLPLLKIVSLPRICDGFNGEYSNYYL